MDHMINIYKKVSGTRQILCLLIAFIGVTMCSKSSFLYTINTWEDSNTIFTVGKGVMNGLVMYRDLYEQKGPYTYFLYGSAYLISHTSFIGVWIFEVVAMTVSFVFIYKLFRKYSDDITSVLGLLIFAMMLFYSSMWVDGGSVEEFVLPMYAFSAYTFLDATENDKNISDKALIINGILAGLVFWSKYTMLGFYGFFMIMLIVFNFIKGKRGKIMRQCIVFLTGMLISTVPIAVYFIANGAVMDLINVYFLGNISNYSVNSGSIVTKTVNIINAMMNSLGYTHINQKNLLFNILLIISVPGVVFSRQLSKFQKLSFFVLEFFTFAGIYYGGHQFNYYPLATVIFAIPGIILSENMLERILNNNHRRNNWKFFASAALAVFSILVLFFRVYYVKKTGSKETLAQYRFAYEISKVPNASILDYQCTDTGFYLICDYIPDFKYFSDFNNAADPRVYSEQRRYVEEGLSVFVITDHITFDWGSYSDTDMSAMTKYELVDECEQTINFRTDRYRLYRLKDKYLDGAFLRNKENR